MTDDRPWYEAPGAPSGAAPPAPPTPPAPGEGSPPPAGSTPSPGSAPPPGSALPPGGGAPPPSGGYPGAGEPPSITAFAWRHGLVRPTQGRMLAGVCGAFGRATNTDPILWRVILVALTIFGGAGVMIYLVAWLMLPADGDTASPIEALLGRGRSRTSTVLTVIAGIVAVGSVIAFLAEPFRPGLLAVALLAVAIVLLLRDQRTRTPVPPRATPWTAGASGDAPPAYAPHGPFAPTGPPPVGFATPPDFGPPVPPPPRSRLGRLTLSVMLVVIGAMVLIDLSGYVVPKMAYPAAALTTVAVGLLIGTWFGRARGLIALGILMSLAVAAGVGRDSIDGVHSGAVTWRPTTVEELSRGYHLDVGNATLDLRGLDLVRIPQPPLTIDVSVDVGNLTIIVPPWADVTVDAKVDVGNADVFDQNWGGLGSGSRTIIDLGKDGPGGGEITMDATVDLGNLEVHR